MIEAPILTAAAMRAAEERIMAAGTSVEALMERAGAAAAEAIWRFAGGIPTLVACGPGNNGGDGYVIARYLKDRGVDVRVGILGEPKTAVAIAARAQWAGAVAPLSDSAPAELLVDALFGTGLTRGLDPASADHLARLASAARLRVAIDLPSGVATDDGAVLSPVPACDMTVALGALKPSHLLQPAARATGRVVVADIGLGAIASDLARIGRPALPVPPRDAHKYSRGMVGVIGGAMPGAARLAAMAAQRAGAGYVALSGVAGGPEALVHRAEKDILADPRVGALVIGPGLGRDDAARARLEAALASDHSLVIDADALVLRGAATANRLRTRTPLSILTPHEGEFAQMFGPLGGSKIDRVREAARLSGAVVLLKGADSVVAAPDGRAALLADAPVWLASAGTGDVLSGIIAALLAQGLAPFDAVKAALWLHGDAARRAGPMLIADDLVVHLADSMRACL